MRVRPGVVLLLALLCLLAIELAVIGLHFAAVQELRVARAGSRILQLRLNAQSAIESAVASWPAAQALALPVGHTMVLPAAAGEDAHYRIRSGASAERLDSTHYLLRAEAVSPLRERSRIGFLLVQPDPARGLASVLLRTSGSVSAGAGAVIGEAAGECAAMSDARAVIQVAAPGSVRADPQAQVSAAVEVHDGLLGAAVESMLPFPLEQLLAGARHITSASVRPGPVETGGRCAAGPVDNWGEPWPDGPAQACRAWLPVLVREGDLTLDGGRGQGVLFVSGNLSLVGATFSGLVLVAGDLSLAGGANIRGSVLVAASAAITDARLTANPCAVSEALLAVSELAGPFRPADRAWVPLF